MPPGHNDGEQRIRAKMDKSEFEDLAKEKPHSLLEEFYIFIVENKKWWMIPILIALGLIGAILILGSTGAAPFIYTLF